MATVTRKMFGRARTALVLVLLFTLLGVACTRPLHRHLSAGIPYERQPTSGSELVRTLPGDYLQTYYWFWLLRDNVCGPSRMFSNPYEFRTHLDENYWYWMFPLSLLYLVFSAAGEVAGYNLTVIASFVLAGAAGYLLTMKVTGSRRAGILGGVIFCLIPFRQSQVASGHTNGFLFFLVPLVLYWCELAVETGRRRPAVAAGLGMLSMATVDIHLIYYLMLLAVPYGIIRFFLGKGGEEPAEAARGGRVPACIPGGHPAAGMTIAALAGVAVGLSFQMYRVHHGLGTFTAGKLGLLLLFYPLAFVALWLLLASIYAHLGGEGMRSSLWQVSLIFLPFFLLPAYGIQFLVDVPFLGSMLVAASCSIFVALGFMLLMKVRVRLGETWKKGLSLRRMLSVLLPAILLGALAAGYVYGEKKFLMKDIYTTSRKGGRTITDVRLFSPRPEDIFVRHNADGDRNIYLGVCAAALALAAVGAVTARLGRGGDARDGIRVGFMLLVLVFGYALSIGPSLGGVLPIYEFAYKYIPFFKYPRASAKLMVVVVPALAVLAGWSVRELERRRLRGWVSPAFTAAAAAMVFFDCLPSGPIGISLLEREHPVYEQVKQEFGDGVRLELPIFPGDSHQSGKYEYYTTISRVPMVNGYSPLVTNRYVREVFDPLRNMNLGEMRPEQYELLKRMGVTCVVLHEDIYFYKVSPFPGYLAAGNLAASPYLERVISARGATLYRVLDTPRGLGQKFTRTCPVGVFYEAENFKRRTGMRAPDVDASAGQAAKAVAGADRPDYLLLGFYHFYPTGEYVATFRLKTSGGLRAGRIARLDASIRGGREQLAQLELSNDDFREEGAWQEFDLPFDVPGPQNVEFRIYFEGQRDLAADWILVRHSKEGGRLLFEAEELLRHVGSVEPDPAASGRYAVRGTAGLDNPSYLTYGPYRLTQPGKYRAAFRVRAEGELPGGPVAGLSVASADSRVFGERTLTGIDLQAAGQYRDFEVAFELSQAEVIELRTYFHGSVDLWVDSVAISREGAR